MPKISNGRLIVALGLLHTALTPVFYPAQFTQFAHHLFFKINDGFLEAQTNYETFAAFWCLFFGLSLIPLGTLLHAYERKLQPSIPFGFAGSYLAVSVLGAYMIPWGGMTVFMLPHAIFMLVRSLPKKLGTNQSDCQSCSPSAHMAR